MARNENRRNGKAFSKTKKVLDEFGRPMSGKGKPSGKSVGGTSVKKIEAREKQARFLASLNREEKAA